MDGGEFSLIDSALSNLKTKKEIQQKEDKLRNEKEKKRLEDLIILENEFAPMKQKFFDEIIQWKNDFIKTDKFREIYKNIGSFDLTIFGSGWGHEIPCCNDFGCWSKIDLKRKGNLIYLSGYKWMGIRNEFDLEKNIEIFSSIYMKKFYEHITSGKVYESIASQIKTFSNFG